MAKRKMFNKVNAREDTLNARKNERRDTNARTSNAREDALNARRTEKRRTNARTSNAREDAMNARKSEKRRTNARTSNAREDALNARKNEKRNTHARTSNAREDVFNSCKDKKQDIIAKNLFSPENKNPYYLRGKEIKNLDELKENLQSFKVTEAMWVADWIRYLGDPKTADQIKNRPKDFKRIIDARHTELSDLFNC